ncbi:class D sortase [Erysipelotrichaceae bacterium OttesenSCG-928-M19]|nr:class D sortase [Erysipelotrichaceae bacterium OttesenSCG-928-M19]
MAKEKAKKKSSLISKLLGILIILCFVSAGVFIYKYFDDINSQWDNSEVALVDAEKALAAKTDYRKEQPIIGTVIGKIKIEGLTGDMPLIEGDDIQLSMAYGVGHLQDTPMPGTFSGQPAVSAHRETFFRPLKDVKMGDIVTITMPYGKFQYRISKKVIAKPNEGEKIFNTEGIEKERIVLITCYPFAAWTSPDERIAFYADLIE